LFKHVYNRRKCPTLSKALKLWYHNKVHWTLLFHKRHLKGRGLLKVYRAHNRGIPWQCGTLNKNKRGGSLTGLGWPKNKKNWRMRFWPLGVELSIGLRGGGGCPFFGIALHPCGLWKSHPQTAQNGENPCGAGCAGLIPRSRNMRNQTKARFSHKPNKKIRFKQITKARFKQITKNDERSEGNHSILVLKWASTIFPPFPISSSTLIWSFMTSPQEWRLG